MRHGFTCFHIQTEHFFGLITGFLRRIAVINEYPLACQRVQRLSRAFAEPITYLAHRERLSRLLKQRQHLTVFAVPLPQSRKSASGASVYVSFRLNHKPAGSMACTQSK